MKIELLVDVNFNDGKKEKGTILDFEVSKLLNKKWYKVVEDHSEDLMTIEEEPKVKEDTVVEEEPKKKKKKK